MNPYSIRITHQSCLNEQAWWDCFRNNFGAKKNRKIPVLSTQGHYEYPFEITEYSSIRIIQ